MSRTVTVIVLATVACTLTYCGGDAPREPRANLPPAKPMCVMKGYPAPPVKYALLKELKLGRQTYGGLRPLTADMVAQAQKTHADAIVNYNGSQRFGFWPWRFIRPVVTGDAVRIENPAAFDCRAAGGEFYTERGYVGPWDPGKTPESEYERGRREERERIDRERGLIR